MSLIRNLPWCPDVSLSIVFNFAFMSGVSRMDISMAWAFLACVLVSTLKGVTWPVNSDTETCSGTLSEFCKGRSSLPAPTGRTTAVGGRPQARFALRSATVAPPGSSTWKVRAVDWGATVEQMTRAVKGTSCSSSSSSSSSSSPPAATPANGPLSSCSVAGMPQWRQMRTPSVTSCEGPKTWHPTSLQPPRTLPSSTTPRREPSTPQTSWSKPPKSSGSWASFGGGAWASSFGGAWASCGSACCPNGLRIWSRAS
mmetsp:Transcript_101567/g.316740  ORF Transcript_101567/g.316740 Transcript_101567/m.316740 type:complete len:255 (+) Transcript_101567:219-983(+)